MFALVYYVCVSLCQRKPFLQVKIEEWLVCVMCILYPQRKRICLKVTIGKCSVYIKESFRERKNEGRRVLCAVCVYSGGGSEGVR